MMANLIPFIRSLNKKTAYVALGAAVAAQFLLALILKLYFFEYN
jgi:hypothetical protein